MTMFVSEFPVQKHSVRVLLPFVVLFISTGLLFTASSGVGYGEVTADVTYSLLLINLLTCIVVYEMTQANGQFSLDLYRPGSLYGFFYFAYYGIPAFLINTGLAKALPFQLEISFMVLCGFVFFFLGTRAPHVFGRGVYQSDAIQIDISDIQAKALIILSYICAALVCYFWIDRIQTGFFYTHARAYGQNLTVSESFLNVFVGTLQLPPILLLGLACRSSSTRIARHARMCLFGFSFGTTFICVLSSSTRLAITAIALLLVALRISNTFRLKARHLVGLVAVSVVFLGFIMGVRKHDEGRLLDSDNQFVDSMQLMGTVFENTDRETFLLSDQTATRACASLSFISEVRGAVEKGYPFLYGGLLVDSAFSLVPRAVWRGKPAVPAIQIEIRNAFQLPIHDDSPGPLLEFYANAGLIGVILGFFFFGYLFAEMTNYAINMKKVWPWFFLAFLWVAAVQVEQEIVMLMLGMLRSALCMYLVYLIICSALQALAKSHSGERIMKLERVGNLHMGQTKQI